jgi:hypothetical protein
VLLVHHLKLALVLEEGRDGLHEVRTRVLGAGLLQAFGGAGEAGQQTLHLHPFVRELVGKRG